MDIKRDGATKDVEVMSGHGFPTSGKSEKKDADLLGNACRIGGKGKLQLKRRCLCWRNSEVDSHKWSDFSKGKEGESNWRTW